MSFLKRLFGGAKKPEPPQAPDNRSDPSVFKCKKCGQMTTHRRIEEQYAGALWLCVCGYKSCRSKTE